MHFYTTHVGHMPTYIIFLDLNGKLFCGYEFTVTFFHLLHLKSRYSSQLCS